MKIEIPEQAAMNFLEDMGQLAKTASNAARALRSGVPSTTDQETRHKELAEAIESFRPIYWPAAQEIEKAIVKAREESARNGTDEEDEGRAKVGDEIHTSVSPATGHQPVVIQGRIERVGKVITRQWDYTKDNMHEAIAIELNDGRPVRYVRDSSRGKVYRAL